MLSTTDELIKPDVKNKTDYSRRGFLRNSLLVTVGTALGLQIIPSCRRSLDELDVIWNELQALLSGNLIKPDASDFQKRAAPWALQYATKWPRAIAICKSAQDVKNCVLWAQRYNIPIVARSGGHSYGGYSTTTGLMIDVSSMNSVEYDAQTKLVKVGGGARNKHVFAACKPLNVAITHGRCYEVGVAGLTLGGGIGFDMRAQGYTCDRLVETEVVLPSGDIVICNANQNADLFWACRGAGGGNFGIHTSFTFRTFDVGNITIFDIKWETNIEAVFLAMQQLIATAPTNLGLKQSVTAVKKSTGITLTLSILGQLAGNESELMTLLEPVYAVQQPTVAKMEYHPYWDGQELISEEGEPEYSHERSRFVKGFFDKNAFEAIKRNLENWPGTTVAATWKFFLLGGVIDQHSPSDMAMVHRGYTMLSSAVVEWTTIDSDATVAQNELWLSQFHEEMKTYTSEFCYQNFIDPSEKNYLNAYYGNNLSRLIEVKGKYDPKNIFTYAQSIPVR